MRSKSLFVVIAAAFIGVLWAFVGLERIVGDHEIGVSWEPFIKHQPSLQMRFTNPIQYGLDTEPFETLSPDEERQFLEFCSIRFGITDGRQCYAEIVGRQI